MSRTYHLEVNNSMAEWLINYQGGFGRRGLLGELFSQISLKYEISIRKVILYFLFFLFFTYYFLIYLFFKDVKKNKLIILSILSPLFIILPLSELEALGRKDLLIPLSFLVYLIIYNKMNFLGLYLFLIFFFPILLLIHEVSIFYFPFFLILLFFKIKNLNYSHLLALIFLSLLVIGIIVTLSNSIHSSDQIRIMCENIKYKLNDQCGMAAFVLNRVLKDNISELGGLNIFHLLRNFLIFVFGYFALTILILNSKLEKLELNILIKHLNVEVIILLLFIPTLIPFAIAVDWGRWFNLSYTMLIFFYFFCLKNKIFNLNENNKMLYFFEKNIFKKKFSYIIIVTLLCFSWNPKAVYHEDVGSIPIYRIITKIIKYY